ncbi:MAG TPA: beta-galactosidase [Ignavibacteriaceae bacterium]|nr:beta-galactosidase [Ignavibacteriaceae bacterium]
MLKKISSYLFFINIIFLFTPQSFSKTIVFYENRFPSSENALITRAALEQALSSLKPFFSDLKSLMNDTTFKEGDLLILPYGSAFPKDAWESINKYISRGNLLIIGGRPLTMPVYLKEKKWIFDVSGNTYSKAIGIQYSYEIGLEKNLYPENDENAPFFKGVELNPLRVFVNAGYGENYRGLIYLVNLKGDRIAAPVTAEDFTWYSQPRRRVYLNFDADLKYWESETGIDLIRRSAVYASKGGVRIWFDIQQLTIPAGGYITGSVDIAQSGKFSKLTLQLLKDSKEVASRFIPCGKKLNEEIGLAVPLNEKSLYELRGTLLNNDTVFEQYSSGIVVRDSLLLQSGSHLEAGRDYFRLNGKPYLPVGVNYFSTDLYTSGFFVGGSIGGNPWVWEKDFTEMERLGLTAVRTGIWLNRIRYLDPVTGSADGRILNAIEAFLHAAARHKFQVIFTFFAFDPQTEMQQGNGQEGNLIGYGSNPYLDPAAIEVQSAYVAAITSRFRSVPFLSFDLINEPSFNNPKRLWKGNSPNGDPLELAAWQNWLKKKYISIDSLRKVWRATPDEIGSFEQVPVPAFEDLELVRSGNSRTIRAVDFNHFAQDAFSRWVDKMFRVIRSTGAEQIITVGQDEGGTADRLLNHFWVNTGVGYTSNHTWWRDDALLWGSAAAKTPFKPNLIEETNIQPVLSMDGTQRWDEIKGSPLLERKLALAFANANAGVLYWDWTHTDVHGLMRRDGSYKKWTEILKGVAKFAKDAESFSDSALLPDIAIVLPHSLQLSTFGSWGIEAQQKSIRALYQFARATAFTIGEYELDKLPEVKLIIVPAPWIFSKEAWNKLLAKVKSGTTLMISGRIDADEHWLTDLRRINELNLGYSNGLLGTRENEITWPGGSGYLTYSGDKTTYAERGFLKDGKTFVDITYGKGRVFYSALPLELADQLDITGQVYRYAIEKSGVKGTYETAIKDPGILISPTRLPDATLYVLTSESSSIQSVIFKDMLSGKTCRTSLEPGRAALLLIDKNGNIKASYNYSEKAGLE